MDLWSTQWACYHSSHLCLIRALFSMGYLICPWELTTTTKKGVSNLWNGLWNGLMEWTDGMEYQLTKIAKTHIMAVAKL